MPLNRPLTGLALVLALTSVAQAGPAKPTKAAAGKAQAPEEDTGPSVESVQTQARTVYTELAGHANPFIRRVVFDGRIALGGDDAKAAIEQGFEDADWPVKVGAVGAALAHKDKALKAKGDAALDLMLESADEKERGFGYTLFDAHVPAKAQLAVLQRAAKNGKPEGRSAARKRLLALDAKTAWAVIEKGLAEPAAEPEHVEAVKALETFDDPIALKWAETNLHTAGAMGDLARGFLGRVAESKATKGLSARIEKAFEASKGEFAQRVQLASVLAGRGRMDLAGKTLLTAIKYKDPDLRHMGWASIKGQRDVAVLAQLRERILTNDEDEVEADAAFAWLTAWGGERGEPKVFEVLQEAAKGDRRAVRMRAIKALTTLKHRPSVTLFEASMTEGQLEIRLAAAEGLASVAQPGDEVRLAAFLRKEPDPRVKEALIGALAAVGTPEILDSLQFVVTAPQANVKLAAAKAIVSTGSPKAAQLLNLLKREPDIDVRFFVWHSLLRLAPQEAEREFKGALAWMRPGDIEALGKDPKVPAAMLEQAAREGREELRMFAVEALAARGNEAATRLLGLVDAPDASTAAAALRALASLRKSESVPTYRKALDSSQAGVRAAAFEAVGLYGPRALLESVFNGTGDKDPLARAQAARAAQRLVERDA